MADPLAELYAAIEKARTLSPTRLGRVVSGLGKRYPGLKLDANLGSAGEIKISRIVVPKEQRGKGIGTKAMRTLNRVADHHEKRSALSPSKDFGGSVPRLKRFYGALGYKPNKGKRKDFAIRETMIREPRVRKSLDGLYEEIAKAESLLPVEKGLKRALRRQFPGEKIKVTRGANGGPAKFMVGSVSRGMVGGEAKRGALQIRNTHVPEEKRGKGVGSKLYSGMARAARGRNQALQSDDGISPSAQRRYRGLARSGAKVFYGGTRAKVMANGPTIPRKDRDWTFNGKPSFVVNPPGGKAPKGYRRVFRKRGD